MNPTKSQREKKQRLHELDLAAAAKTRAFIADLKKPGPHPDSCLCGGRGWLSTGPSGAVPDGARIIVRRSPTGATTYYCPLEPAA